MYLLATSIYNIVANNNKTGMIFNGGSAAIGGAITYGAIQDIRTPAAVIMGGVRRWY
jgi:hypothetical protein